MGCPDYCIDMSPPPYLSKDTPFLTPQRIKPMEELIELFREPHRDMLPEHSSPKRDDLTLESCLQEDKEPSPLHPPLFDCLVSLTRPFLLNSSHILSTCHDTCTLSATLGENSTLQTPDAKPNLSTLVCIFNCTTHHVGHIMILAAPLQGCLAKASIYELCTLTGCLLIPMLWAIWSVLTFWGFFVKPSTSRQESAMPSLEEPSTIDREPFIMLAERIIPSEDDHSLHETSAVAARGVPRSPPPANTVEPADATSAHPLSPSAFGKVNVIDVPSESPVPVAGGDSVLLPAKEPSSPTPSSGAAAAVLHQMATAASSFMTGLNNSPARRAAASTQLLPEGDGDDGDDGDVCNSSPSGSDKAMSSDDWERT